MKRVLLALFLFSTSQQVRPDTSDGTFSAKITPDPQGPALPITDYTGTVQAFRTEYQKANKPKLLLYVNRSLVTNRGELLDLAEIKTSTQTKGDPVPLESNANVQIGDDNQAGKESKTATGKGGERTETTSGALRVNTERNLGVTAVSEYEAREIEEVFQKPLFEAGARIVDQKTALLATQTFADAGENFLSSPRTDKEKQEIQSLQKSTDIVIEILARKKAVFLPMPSGNDQKEERLELIATATSLKDGVRLAQVGSDSLFGFNERFGDRKERRYRQVTSAEIIEQTALALLQRISF